jgi:hypothetical protein
MKLRLRYFGQEGVRELDNAKLSVFVAPKQFNLFVFHHSMELLCDSYYCLEKLLEAMFTYDGVRNLGCTLLLFCVHVNFLWSKRIDARLFVLCLDLGDAICCMQVMFLDNYGK